MGFSKKQEADLASIIYFANGLGEGRCVAPISEQDKIDFMAFSDRGIAPEQLADLPRQVCTQRGKKFKCSVGFWLLFWGKVWRMRFVKEFLEPDFQTGDWFGWITLLGGSYDDKPLPRAVVDYYKKEFCSGMYADRIEAVYQQILAAQDICLAVFRSEGCEAI